MVPFSQDGFWGVGIVLIMWGASLLDPHPPVAPPWLIVGCGIAMILIALFYPSFFRQFDSDGAGEASSPENEKL